MATIELMATTVDSHTVDGAAPYIAFVTVLSCLYRSMLKRILLHKAGALDRAWDAGFVLLLYDCAVAIDQNRLGGRLVEYAGCLAETKQRGMSTSQFRPVRRCRAHHSQR